MRNPTMIIAACLLTLVLACAAQADDAPKPLGDLPWVPRAATPGTTSDADRVTNVRQLLVNVAPSEFESFTDGDPLSPNTDTLAKILYRLPRILPSEIQRLARTEPDWTQLLDRPAEHRVAVVRIEGHVRRVEKHAMPPEMAELFEFDQQYLVTFELPEMNQPVVVHALRVPEAWKKHGDELNERAVAYGLFLQVGRGDDDQPSLHFAADRVAWLPDRVNPQLNVSASETVLGRLGVDVGLLDVARQRNRKPLEAADYELFYQLLAASRTVSTASEPIVEPAAFDLIEVLTKPETRQGEWMSVRGRARRITKIVVDSADVRERFGIEHYYQIDSLVPVGRTPIRFDTGKVGGDATEAPSYGDSFPMTLCALELPPELEAARRRAEDLGPDAMLNEAIRFEGFFHKIWVYRSRYTSQFDERLLQPSPFFVAYRPEMAPGMAGNNVWLGLGLGLAFLAGLVGLWILIWRYGKSDTNIERRMRERHEARDMKSLNERELDVKTEPDFSNLDP